VRAGDNLSWNRPQQRLKIKARLWVQMGLRFLEQRDRVSWKVRAIPTEAPFVKDALNLQGTEAPRSGAVQPHRQASRPSVETHLDHPDEFLQPPGQGIHLGCADACDRALKSDEPRTHSRQRCTATHDASTEILEIRLEGLPLSFRYV